MPAADGPAALKRVSTHLDPRGRRIAVVGAGPAGLTAAHHLSIKGYRVSVFESEPEPGGMLYCAIPEYRLPHDVITIRQSSTQALNDYDGTFDHDEELIRVGESAEYSTVPTHELAHAWFNRSTMAEMWMIEGLTDGRIAFVLKAHHAIADGMASVHLFTRMLRPLAQDESPPDWRPRALPGSFRLVADALWDHVRLDALQFPGFLRTVLVRLKSARVHRERADVPVFDPLADTIPAAPFNGAQR